jgi:hypothetical protein
MAVYKSLLSLVFGVFLVLALVVLMINLFRSAEIRGIQAELTGAEGTAVTMGDSVAFNTVLNIQSSNIIYNPATGEFIITRAGTYHVSWWLAANGAAPVGASFAVAVNNTPFATSSLPAASGLLSGDALVTVVLIPTIVSLINVTAKPVAFASTPVQAGILITEVID